MTFVFKAGEDPCEVEDSAFQARIGMVTIIQSESIFIHGQLLMKRHYDTIVVLAISVAPAAVNVQQHPREFSGNPLSRALAAMKSIMPERMGRSALALWRAKPGLFIVDCAYLRI